MRARPTRRRVALALASLAAFSLALAGCAADESVEIDVPAQVDAAFPEATAQQLQDAVTQAMTAAGASGAIGRRLGAVERIARHGRRGGIAHERQARQ